MRRAVEVGGVKCALGDIVALDAPDRDADDDEDDAAQPEQAPLAQLQALWQTASKAKMAQVRAVVLLTQTGLRGAGWTHRRTVLLMVAGG